MAITIKFLGAAGTVTGSKYLISFADKKYLVDAGMFQGDKEWRQRNWDPFAEDPATLDGILLTHAHMDHCGYLPALVKQGFSGPIWATAGSVALANIVLRDAGYLQEREAQEAAEGGYSKHNPPLPLYSVEDVEDTLPLFRTVPFDTDLDLGGAIARYTRSGHILGSASIRVATEDSSVLFSGDVGRTTHPVLRSREIPPGADYVLIESTYGDRDHPEPSVAHEDFANAIHRTIKRGGVVLIPAFAVDRTEVVLKTLTELIAEGRIHDVPIYVNSPMALAALQVYRSAEMRSELRDDINVDTFINLPQLREVRSTEESIALNRPNGPCIIISSSGMATGGRVLHHLEHLLPDARNCVILTGYQAAGTRGRALQEGATQLKMRGKYIPVKAEIVSDHEFSVHGDRSDLLDWLSALSPTPKVTFCVHGEADSAAAFAQSIRGQLDTVALVPRYGEVVRASSTGQIEVLNEGEATPAATPATPAKATSTSAARPPKARSYPGSNVRSAARHPLDRTPPARKRRREDKQPAVIEPRLSPQRTAVDDFFARYGQLWAARRSDALAELYTYPLPILRPDDTSIIADSTAGQAWLAEMMAGDPTISSLPEVVLGDLPGSRFIWAFVTWVSQDVHGRVMGRYPQAYQLSGTGSDLRIVAVSVAT